MNPEQSISYLNALSMPALAPSGGSISPNALSMRTLATLGDDILPNALSTRALAPLGDDILLDAPPVPQPSETGPGAGLQGNKLIAFTSSLEPKYREAVKYSTQIAQRAADAAYNQLSQRLQWYAKYTEVLKHSGWIGSNNQLSEYKHSKTDLTMEQIALQLIQAAAGPNAATILEISQLAIDALKGNEAANLKLEKSSSQSASGAFDILPCLQSDDEVVMYNHAMIFTRKKSSGGFWFWSWKAEHVDLTHVANEWTLNYDFYTTVEGTIRKKLGAASEDFFEKLDLG